LIRRFAKIGNEKKHLTPDLLVLEEDDSVLRLLTKHTHNHHPPTPQCANQTQGSIIIAPPTLDDSETEIDLWKVPRSHLFGDEGGGKAGAISFVGGEEVRLDRFASRKSVAEVGGCGGGESIVDLFNEVDIQTSPVQPEREIEHAFEALSREGFPASGRLLSAREGDEGYFGGGGEEAFSDGRVRDQKEGKEQGTLDVSPQSPNKFRRKQRCRSLDMARPTRSAVVKEHPARFSFCLSEERWREASDDTDFDIVSLQLLRLE